MFSMLSSSRILSVQRFPGKRLYSVSCTIPRAYHGKTLTGSQFHRFLSHPRHENAHFGVSLCPFFPFTISDLTTPLKTREIYVVDLTGHKDPTRLRSRASVRTRPTHPRSLPLYVL